MPSFYGSISTQTFFSSSTRSGKTETRSYSEHKTTSPEGTTVRTVYRENDKPVQRTEEHYASNRPLGAASGHTFSRRIEDVSDQDTDVRYKVSIQDGFTKREGGA